MQKYSRFSVIADGRPALQSYRVRKLTASIAITAALFGILGLVLLSPLLMGRLDTVGGLDWTRLSYVGQTYGAASAVLAAVALAGISVSLLVQIRQTRVQQVQAVRSFHLELMRITLENPSLYVPCWGWAFDAPTVDSERQQVFMMNHERMGYELGIISEASLRDVFLNEMFASDIGRRYWDKAQHDWGPALRHSRRSSQFVPSYRTNTRGPALLVPRPASQRAITAPSARCG